MLKHAKVRTLLGAKCPCHAIVDQMIRTVDVIVKGLGDGLVDNEAGLLGEAYSARMRGDHALGLLLEARNEQETRMIVASELRTHAYHDAILTEQQIAMTAELRRWDTAGRPLTVESIYCAS